MTKEEIKKLIREVMSESPQIGYNIDWEQLAKISSLIGKQAGNPDTKLDVDGEYCWISGPILGSVYHFYCVLFRKIDDKFQCCFACLLEQVPKINGLITYQPKFSFKMSPFPEKAAAKTYIKLMKSHNCNIVSDSEQSDAGMEIWKEMLNNPELKDRIFVWDNKNRKMIDTIKPEEIWGHEDKFKDILIGIMV